MSYKKIIFGFLALLVVSIICILIGRKLHDTDSLYEENEEHKNITVSVENDIVDISEDSEDVTEGLIEISEDNENTQIQVLATDMDTVDEDLYAPTVKKLLMAALEPVGTTLYVYGGGWNEEDTAAGVEALSYGISPRWKEFFDENNASYNYQNTMYQIHDGLDCTGYVGYAVYQIFGDTYSDIGYVFKSKDMVSEYAGMFDSTFVSRYDIDRYYPGDIMGKSGHVFMVIGECSDGSLLFLQASPPVVSLCGTPTPSGNNDSEAVRLAREYMSKYYSESYAWYDSCIRDTTFLTNYDQMHWNRNILQDPDGYDDMTPEEILKDLFGE